MSSQDISEHSNILFQQYSMPITWGEKVVAIRYLVNKLTDETGQIIVFCERKGECDQIARGLHEEAYALHGDLSQSVRNSVLKVTNHA